MNLAERYPPGLARAQAYSEHAPVLTMLPFFRRGITYAQRSLAIRRDARDAWGEGQSLHFYGVVLYGASRYREAMERCREGARLLEQTGDRWEVNTANWHVAYCLYRLGSLREAVDAARAVHQAGVEIGDAQAAGISLSVWAKASGGRVPPELIDAELARGGGDGHTTAEVLQARAVCLLAGARPDEAVAVLEEARSLLKARGLRQEYVAPVLPWLATARREQVLATQDVTPDSRRRLLREARRAARRARRMAHWYRNNLPHALRESALVDALRGRSSRARRHFDRSLAVASRQSAAWEHAQTLLARGQVGLELGWRGAAEDLAVAGAAMAELAADVRAEQGDGPARREERAGQLATLSLADRFDTVLEVGWSITAALTREAIFSAVRDAGTSLLRGERCVVLEVGDTRGEDVTTVSSEIDASVDDLCRQLVRTAVVTGRVAFLATGQEDDRSGALLTGGETRSAVCAPVRVRDRVVAAFYASHSQVRDLFGAEEERLAEFIATLAGAALENAEGFGEVQALTRTLEERVEERTAQLAAVNRELTHQAFHDPLTQLANRVLFGDRIHHAITVRQRTPGRLAVLLVDLDDFKSVNDTWGHAVGDELLTSVAARLEQCLRPADTLARLGGDEFGILLEDPRESAAATAVAERIVAALAAPFRLQGFEVWIHASIGIAVDEGHADGAEALLRKADAAMYVAKERGKDRVAVFQPQMLDAVITRGQLRAALQVALEEHGKPQFAVHYQPIVELDSGRVTSVEALLRWQRPAGEVATPDVFVPLAEEAGFIVALGGWVLECACHQVAAWQQAQPDAPPLGLHVNLSARQLQEPRLVGVVAGLLADTGLVPDSLVLEITETALMRDPDAADAQLHALRELGVRLALDDFGTGYSALAYLQRFSLNLLKIDKSFVDGLGSLPGASSLVRAIVQIGQTLTMEVVAEGIEQPVQAMELQALGCRLGQGFLWSPARTTHELEPWVRDRARTPTLPRIRPAD
ncbi:MAG: EAL domain-containing protein [Egibacteraceae bacterium]